MGIKSAGKFVMTSTLAALLVTVTGSALPVRAAEFHSAWPKDAQRVWVGPEYWANRLQDWRITNGRLECVEGRPDKPMRTVHLLTHSLGTGRGEFTMSVRTGRVKGASKGLSTAWTGFLIGAGEGKMDYRGAALVHHLPGKGGGIIAALEGTGRGVRSGKGVWERRRVGIGNICGLGTPIQFIRLVGPGPGYYHFYLDNITWHRTNGERHNIWKEGRDLIRNEKAIPKHPAFENVELNIVQLSAVK